LKQLLKKNLAIFLVVTELAIDPAVASQRTVDTNGVFAIELGGDAFGSSYYKKIWLVFAI
jgi:hypothetical protein